MSRELADAWQHFSNLVTQEFIYDCWWGVLSPDTKFPAHTRMLLNNAFAGLLRRAKMLHLHSCSSHILDSLAVRACSQLAGIGSAHLSDEEVLHIMHSGCASCTPL